MGSASKGARPCLAWRLPWRLAASVVVLVPRLSPTREEVLLAPEVACPAAGGLVVGSVGLGLLHNPRRLSHKASGASAVAIWAEIRGCYREV